MTPEDNPVTNPDTKVGSDITWKGLLESCLDELRETGEVSTETGELVKPFGEDRAERLDTVLAVASAVIDLERVQATLRSRVDAARDANASWEDIGTAVGTTAVSAARKFDSEARRKHSSYYKPKEQDVD